MKEEKIALKGKMRTYLQVPLLLGIILALVNVWIYLLDFKSAIILSAFLIIYLVTIIVMLSISKTAVINELVSFATQYGQIQKQLLKDLDLPHALLDENGKIIWMNKAFEFIASKEECYLKPITQLLPEVTKDKMPVDENNTECNTSFEDKDYLVRMKRICLKDVALLSGDAKAGDGYDGYLIAIYLYDETALNVALREVDNQSLVVGFIYIDNYEEAMESVEDVGRSLLSAFIDRQVNQYVSSIDGIVRKTEKDKYLVILRKSALNTLKEGRFKLLEDVKEINIGNETAVTLSIGIGLDGLTYTQNAEFARNAIDLALGRGGDQAVIKSPAGVSYFGGKSQQKESTTRVKARVKALALQEIISLKDKVFVMGHANGDVDSFGASVGIKCACQSLGKECHIVLEDVSKALKPLVDRFMSYPEYEEDWIITRDEAIQMAEGNTVLVVVDVNKPSLTECPELIKKCKSIVVLDHHRQGTEIIENATLSYIEPYASSASEMVAEILQYINGGIKLKGIIADCLYGGIVIDTQNFEQKTGVRTFEAAAFLRRSGADITLIRKMFRENANDYKVKAEAVRHAEIFREDYAISHTEGDGVESPTVLAAQAANELLNIEGIKASFVLTDYSGKIYISARSIDEVNVQLIMERMGGGGHMTIAGAQLEGETIDHAKEMLRNTIDEMVKEGAI